MAKHPPRLEALIKRASAIDPLAGKLMREQADEMHASETVKALLAEDFDLGGAIGKALKAKRDVGATTGRNLTVGARPGGGKLFDRILKSADRENAKQILRKAIEKDPVAVAKMFDISTDEIASDGVHDMSARIAKRRAQNLKEGR